MTDIVERLRGWGDGDYALRNEAADEIERLRAAISQAMLFLNDKSTAAAFIQERLDRALKHDPDYGNQWTSRKDMGGR